MHCRVGLAILVKVAPISDCFDGGTQSVSMVGTPVSLMPRSSAFAKVGIFNGGSRHSHAGSCKRLRGAPTSDHVRSAQAHELAARIRQLAEPSELTSAGLEFAGL